MESSTSVRLVRLSPKRQRTAEVQNLAESHPPREKSRKRFGLRLPPTALEWGVNKPNAHQNVQRRSAGRSRRPFGSYVCLQSVRGLPLSKTSRYSPGRERRREAFWTAVVFYRFGMGREQTQRAPIRSTPVSCESSTSIRLARLSPKRQRTAAVQNLAEFPPPRETPRSCQTRLAQPKFAAGRDWCSGWRGPDHSFRVHPIILYKFILSDPTLTF